MEGPQRLLHILLWSICVTQSLKSDQSQCSALKERVLCSPSDVAAKEGYDKLYPFCDIYYHFKNNNKKKKKKMFI